MEDIAQLVQLMQKQLEMQQLQFEKQKERHLQQMELTINRLETGSPAPVAPAASVPSFTFFHPTLKLWKDYRARFHMFVGANTVPQGKTAQVFLTNQMTTTCKLLCTLAGQQAPPQDINTLIMEDIAKFMETQFDAKQFIVRERFKYWSDVQRKP